MKDKITKVLVSWLGEDDNGEEDNYFDLTNELHTLFLQLAKELVVVDTDKVRNIISTSSAIEHLLPSEIVVLAHAIATGDVVKVIK